MSLYLRDNRHAANVFGFTGRCLNHGTPRFKFEFFVNIEFDSRVLGLVKSFLGEDVENSLYALCKTVTMPSFTVRTRTMNQYNRHRILQERLEPQTMTMTFHDSVDGRTLKLWELYYRYYYQDGGNTLGEFSQLDGRKFDTVEPRFVDRFGYNSEIVGNTRQLITNIDVFQIHSGHISRVSAVSPTVTGFTHDVYDYAASGETMQFELTFQPEYVVYDNNNRSLTAEQLERFRRGDPGQISNFLGPPCEPKQRTPVDLAAETGVSQVTRSPQVPQSSNPFDAVQRSLNALNVQPPIPDAGFDPRGPVAAVSPVSRNSTLDNVLKQIPGSGPQPGPIAQALQRRPGPGAP